MRNTILGWIGVIWGGLLVSSGIRGALAGELGTGAYGVGQVMGILFGAVLLYAGIRALRSPRKPAPSESPAEHG